MTIQFSEELHFVTSHAPKADLYDGNPAGTAVSLRNYEAASFLLQQATAGTNTGTAVVTVQECDSAAGGNPVAIPFRYRKKTTGAAVDTWGDWVNVAAAGFTTTANENTAYEIFVEARDLSETKPFVRLLLTEGTNDPVSGGVLAILYRARFGGIDKPSARS